MSAATLGVFAASLADERLDPADAIARAAGWGFGHCLFGSVFELSARLDPGELAAVRAAAAAVGVELTVGSVNVHPFRLGQDRRLLDAGGGDALAGFDRMLAASRAAGDGCDLLAIVGRIEDRYDRLTPWSEQLQATADLLGRLVPLLRAYDLRLALKTHEEITAAEVARLLEAVGSETVSVCLDPVNLLVNLDDPVTSARQLGGAVAQVILDDAVIVPVGERGARLLCPVGDGVIDWDGLAGLAWPAPVTWWVELHRGQFDVAPFDPDWLAAHPELTRTRLAAGVAQLVRGAAVPPARRRALRAAQARPSTRLDAAVRAARRLLRLPDPNPLQQREDHHDRPDR
jgi:sugar phosphate isomerase/epimerase